MTRLRRTAALTATLALLASACSGGGESDPETEASGGSATEASQLAVQVASFDMAAGQDQRLLVGLFTPERGVIGGGEVDVRVGRLSDNASENDQVVMSDPVTAEFLPVPGAEPDVGDAPQVIEGDGVGVYEASVDLEEAGNWGVQVSAELDGETVTATAAFPVAEQHTVPAVGDPAPSVDNPTADSSDVEARAIDSRAQGEDAEVPDPDLHDAVVSEVLEQGEPMVVAISTPVYCVSRFCGPITDHIAEMAEQYGDRAEFVHLEVWQDFESQALNPWVEDWVFDPETGGNEPWVFLVGADGTIQARWDNVLDGEELTEMLDGLPGA